MSCKTFRIKVLINQIHFIIMLLIQANLIILNKIIKVLGNYLKFEYIIFCFLFKLKFSKRDLSIRK